MERSEASLGQLRFYFFIVFPTPFTFETLSNSWASCHYALLQHTTIHIVHRENVTSSQLYCSCILDIIILIITYIRKICKNYAEQNMRTNDIAMA